MLILGVDPGNAVTGYGIIEHKDRCCRLIDYGCFRTRSTFSSAQRLKKIYTELMETIARYGPDEVAVEEAFYGNNVKTALKIGQVKGIVLLAAAKADLPVAEYAPREVKNSVVGSGAATKEQVQFMVRSILRLKEMPQPYDASDALAVALCHAHQMTIPQAPIRRKDPEVERLLSRWKGKSRR